MTPKRHYTTAGHRLGYRCCGRSIVLSVSDLAGGGPTQVAPACFPYGRAVMKSFLPDLLLVYRQSSAAPTISLSDGPRSETVTIDASALDCDGVERPFRETPANQRTPIRRKSFHSNRMDGVSQNETHRETISERQKGF